MKRILWEQFQCYIDSEVMDKEHQTAGNIELPIGKELLSICRVRFLDVYSVDSERGSDADCR